MAHSSHPIPPAGGVGGGMWGREEGSAVFSVLNVQVCTGTEHVRKRKEGRKVQHEQRREGGRRLSGLS